jgi:hypothetical protein
MAKTLEGRRTQLPLVSQTAVWEAMCDSCTLPTAVAVREAGGEVLLQASGADRPGRPDRDDPRPRSLSAPVAVEGDVHPFSHHLQHRAALGCLGGGYDALGPVDGRWQLRGRPAQGVQ